MALETASPRGHDVQLRYRNREVTTADLEFLRAQCSSTTTRGELVTSVCEAWQWSQVNGGLSVYAARTCCFDWRNVAF